MNSCRFPYFKKLGPNIEPPTPESVIPRLLHVCTQKSASLQSQWNTIAKTREWEWCVVKRDATRSVATNSDNRTTPHTFYVQRRGTVSEDSVGELSERGFYHANLRSSITCCGGNYNSSDHKFTPICYTHYDINCNHVAGFTRGLMPIPAGQCNCS